MGACHLSELVIDNICTVPTSQLWAYDADANAKKNNKQHVKLSSVLNVC